MEIRIAIFFLAAIVVFAVWIRIGAQESPDSLTVYRCSECGRQIESLLNDAGSKDICPACGKAVTVPGEAERRLVQEADVSRQDSTSRFTVEWTFHEAVEAAVAKAALDEAGIPYLADDF